MKTIAPIYNKNVLCINKYILQIQNLKHYSEIHVLIKMKNNNKPCILEFWISFVVSYA